MTMSRQVISSANILLISGAMMKAMRTNRGLTAIELVFIMLQATLLFLMYFFGGFLVGVRSEASVACSVAPVL